MSARDVMTELVLGQFGLQDAQDRYEAYRSFVKFLETHPHFRGRLRRTGTRIHERYTYNYESSTYVEALDMDMGVVPLKEALEKLERFSRVRTRVRKGVVLFVAKNSAMQQTLNSSVSPLVVRGYGDNRYTYDFLLEQAVEELKTFQYAYLAQWRESRRQPMVIPEKAHRSGGGSLNTFLSQRRSIKHANEAVALFPIPSSGVLSSLNWGIEVEVAGARGVERQPGWGKKSDGSLESAYDDNGWYDDYSTAYSVWRDARPVREDDQTEEDFRQRNENWYAEEPDESSFEPEDFDGDDTAEFVSPILHSYHSRGLRKMIEQINTQPQNDSAGVHVHVEASHLTPRQVGSLVFGYTVVENILESSYHREVRNYCKPITPDGLRIVTKSAKTVSRSVYGTIRDIEPYDRYLSLNLQAIVDHGTVEFRAMGPVYDYDHLVRWASICREFVNVAAAGVKPKEWLAVKDAQDLLNLFIRKGKETSEHFISDITRQDIDNIFATNDEFRYRHSEAISHADLVSLGGEI